MNIQQQYAHAMLEAHTAKRPFSLFGPCFRAAVNWHMPHSTDQELQRLRGYVGVLGKLLAEREHLLHAIPHCPAHGRDCVPHALEWVERAKARLVSYEGKPIPANPYQLGDPKHTAWARGFAGRML